MKKVIFIISGFLITLTSCIKVDIDNSDNSTNTGGGGNFNTKQEEIISTKTITGVINNGEIVELPKAKYFLKGYVYVNGRATIRFAPGSVIVSDSITKGALIIEQNSRIFCEGTATEPIIFTSGKSPATRAPGDWGGIVILGNSVTNRTTPPIIEGGINAVYGGSVVADNSGILRYVRIEFAGIAADPNSEINGLTLGGVGSGTKLEYIQVSYGNDDAYEFFGGRVDARYLIALATADDDYDFDFGYQGRLQFGVALRDPLFVDPGDAGNGVECDNDATGSLIAPFTRPVISNFTWCGPNDAAGTLANHNFNMRWRRSTEFEVHNSILMGYMDAGFSIENDATVSRYKNDTSFFKNNLVHAITAPFRSGTAAIMTSAEVETKALSQGNTKNTVAEINLTAPFSLTAPNFIPNAGSPALAGAVFAINGINNTFFQTTTYRGAFGTTNWMTGWTSFTPKSNIY
jgi:hypothetical protein